MMKHKEKMFTEYDINKINIGSFISSHVASHVTQIVCERDCNL